MKQVFVHNLKHPDLEPVQARYCDGFWCRLRGFMFRKQIGPEEGLILVHSRESRLDTAIHMLAVFTDLAVYWLDPDNQIVDRCLARSWRPFYMPERPAVKVFECAPERYEDFQVGDTLQLETRASH